MFLKDRPMLNTFHTGWHTQFQTSQNKRLITNIPKPPDIFRNSDKRHSSQLFIPVNLRHFSVDKCQREKKSIKQLKQPTKFHYITKEEQCVLHNLQKQQDIIISPADKGGAVVLQYWDHYTKQATKQMAETRYFKMPCFFHSEVEKLFLQHEIAYKMYTSHNDIRVGKMPRFTSQTMGYPTILRYSQLPEKVAVLW